MDTLFEQYYGIDWLAMSLSLLFIYFIGNKNKYGFIFGVLSCFAWIFVNYLASIWPGILLNILLIILHTRGYIKWGKNNLNPTTETM